MSCPTCQTLWSFFTSTPKSEQTLNLGTFATALSSPCPDHTKIIRDFKAEFDRHPHGPREPHRLGFISNLRNAGRRSVTLTADVETLGMTWEMVAVRKSGEEGGVSVGRVMDREWVDLDLVQGWRKDCEENHKEKCCNPLRIPARTPRWLVDVQRNCVVAAEKGMEYVALSYRCTDNMVPVKFLALQTEGAFGKADILDELPLSIVHAISLTSALNERYIWIDDFCIHSSDALPPSTEPYPRTSILANALFTIVLPSGPKDAGIPGLHAISTPRNLEQKVYHIGSNQLAKRNGYIFSLENGHKSATKGWSYQDFKLSPRKLILRDGEAHWQCNRSVQHEEFILGGAPDVYIDPRPAVLALGYPDLGSLDNILANHNEKEVPRGDDPLEGVAELLKVFSRSFEGGFLFGLPECLFDRALAWQPQWSHTNLRRRYTGGEVPSWSWAAWEGLFSFSYGEPMRVNDIGHVLEETIPITEWYTSCFPTGPQRRVQSTWFERRERRKHVDEALPKGWERLPALEKGDWRDEPRLYPDGCGKFLYRHESFPDKDNELCYYPFEVPDIGMDTPFEVPVLSGE